MNRRLLRGEETGAQCWPADDWPPLRPVWPTFARLVAAWRMGQCRATLSLGAEV